MFCALAQILVIVGESVYWVKQPAHSSFFFVEMEKWLVYLLLFYIDKHHKAAAMESDDVLNESAELYREN